MKLPTGMKTPEKITLSTLREDTFFTRVNQQFGNKYFYKNATAISIHTRTSLQILLIIYELLSIYLYWENYKFPVSNVLNQYHVKTTRGNK